MIEIGIAEYFDIGAALGIIGTMFVVLYYSRKQAQGLSADIETKDSKRLGRESSQDDGHDYYKVGLYNYRLLIIFHCLQ